MTIIAENKETITVNVFILNFLKILIPILFVFINLIFLRENLNRKLY